MRFAEAGELVLPSQEYYRQIASEIGLSRAQVILT
jgi:hypothetical protein